MNKVIVSQVVKIVLPALAGAAGGWLVTAFPAAHQAFCAAV